MGFWRGFGNLITFGAIDRLEAEDIKKQAELLLETTQNDLEESRAITQQTLAAYGEMKKICTLKGALAEYKSLYERIGKIKGREPRHQQLLERSKINIQKLENVAVSVEEIAGATGAAAVGGAAAVAGAYGLAGLIGTASTGTAIGTLSGAAATNATLAWLGGGALSVGGAGMAGGAMVLGGIALAPFALIAGGLFAAKASQQLNEAENFYDKVEVETEKMQTLISQLALIRQGTEILQNLATSLEQLLEVLNKDLENIIYSCEKRREIKYITEYSHRKSSERSQKNFLVRFFLNTFAPLVDEVSLQKMSNSNSLPPKLTAEISVASLPFSDEELIHLMNTCNTADLLVKVLDTPLMDEEGAFLNEPVNQMLEIAERMHSAETEGEVFQVIGEAQQAMPARLENRSAHE